MKNRLLLVGALSVLSLSFEPLSAEGSYAGFGVGLHFDLGTLGETIATDGLDSNVGNPSLKNHQRGTTGCGDDVECRREQPGNSQQLIVPENKLIALENSTNQAFTTKAKGAMTGLVLNGFWEKEGENTFLRIGVDYTRKIAGGDTESYLAGVKWYDIHWDYRSVFVPVYYGYKARLGDTSAVYAGAGINYFFGGWDLSGNNLGDIPTYVLGLPVGTSSVVDQNGKSKGGSVMSENIRFRTRGVGFNVVIGVEKNTDSGNKVFFEIDRKFAAKYSTSRLSTSAGASALAPFASYPQNLSGTIYRFGHKWAM